MNPGVGQRGAAKATREKFNLKTFSHSTVSRSFKSFEDAREMALGNRHGEGLDISGAEGLAVIMPAPKGAAKSDGEARAGTSGKPDAGGRFPSASDTAGRRKLMAAFLPKFPNGAKLADIEAAGCQSALDWHRKYRRLLL